MIREDAKRLAHRLVELQLALHQTDPENSGTAVRSVQLVAIQIAPVVAKDGRIEKSKFLALCGVKKRPKGRAEPLTAEEEQHLRDLMHERYEEIDARTLNIIGTGHRRK